MKKQWILTLGVVVIFGVLVPWYKGLDFLDPVMIVAYSCLGLLFVAPSTAEAFSATQPIPTTSETFRRAARVLGYGFGVTVLILGAGIATVNLTHWHGSILAPPLALLTATLLLGLTACLVVIGVCALLARKLSAAAVKGVIRLVFLILLAMLALGNRFLPEEAQAALAARMTTDGITRLALVTSAVLACCGAALTTAAALVPIADGSPSS